MFKPSPPFNFRKGGGNPSPFLFFCSRSLLKLQFCLFDFNGTFDVEMGENQAVHAFEARSLAGTCGKGGVLWTYTVFGEDTPDEP